MKISVIVAVTRPHRVGEVLRDVARQDTAAAVEVVLAWDGVSVQALGDWPFPMRSLRVGPKGREGPATAWNAAIAAAAGDVLALCDDDDRWHPDHLSAALAQLANGCSAVHGAAWVVDERSGRRYPFHFPASPEVVRQTNPVIPSTLVFTRQAWQRTGPFDPGFGLYADWDWVLRSLQAGVIWGRVAHPTAEYRWRGAAGDNLSVTAARRHQHLRALCERHQLGPLPPADFFLMATDRRWDRWRLSLHSGAAG